jgi:hypothetical protein
MLAAALTVTGTSAVQASINAPSDAGGSEAVLWVIRNSDSAAVAQDLGLQISQITAATPAVSLSSTVSSFISGAGGLSGVVFSVTAANTTSRTYLTTLASSPAPTIKNQVINGTWNSAITNSSVGALNNGDATPPATNNSYPATGDYPTSDLTNPVTSGFTFWGSSTDNTGPGNTDLFLFNYVAGTAPTGNAAVSATYPSAQARLTATQLQFVTLSVDTDGDGIADTLDNCTLVSNANQRDTNGDGYGNICDPDFNGDGTVNINDFNRLKARLNILPVVDVDTDLDGNGAVNINDFNRLKSFLGKPTGPSGLHPNCPPTCP